MSRLTNPQVHNSHGMSESCRGYLLRKAATIPTQVGRSNANVASDRGRSVVWRTCDKTHTHTCASVLKQEATCVAAWPWRRLTTACAHHEALEVRVFVFTWACSARRRYDAMCLQASKPSCCAVRATHLGGLVIIVDRRNAKWRRSAGCGTHPKPACF